MNCAIFLFISRAEAAPGGDDHRRLLVEAESAAGVGAAGEDELLPHGHTDRDNTGRVAVGRAAVREAHQDAVDLIGHHFVARPGTALDSCTAVGMPRRAPSWSIG